MLEQQAPNDVEPTDHDAEECDEDRGDKIEGLLGLNCGRPSHDNLNDPVHKRDEKQDDLDHATLAVEPAGN